MTKSYTTPAQSDSNQPKSEFIEKVVQIDRVTRTVKGGHRMRFRTLVVVGDKNGRVGYGIGKSNEIASAVAKATTYAKHHLIKVSIINGTISHEVTFHDGAALIMLKPARQGTSVVAGGSVRAVIEACGIKNILTKIIGTSNKAANVKATINALKSLSSNQE